VSGPGYHGRTHAPGGTDPIPAASSDLSWAVATKFSRSTSAASGRYRGIFETLGTNDTDTFELAGISGTEASWLQINNEGYYVCYFGMNIESPTKWGANNAQLEPLVDLSGDVVIDTEANTTSDWNIGGPSLAAVHLSSLSTALYQGMFRVVTFNYNPGDGSDLGALSPLKLACRVAAVDVGTKDISTQVFVQRIAATAGFTLTDLTA
jgi:hypothetical protein